MSVRERYRGFCTPWSRPASAGPEWVMYGDYQREFGQQALKRLFSQPLRPTAVFAASDYLVLGLLDGLRACGLQAPEALSLVGFDDAACWLPSRVSPPSASPRRSWATPR